MCRGLIISVILASALVLVGCDGNGVERTGPEEQAAKASVSDRFICNSSSYRFETVIDSKTGVTYLVWTSFQAGSDTRVVGITVLLNSDGSPVISEGHAQGNQNASHEKIGGGADGDST